MPVRKPRAVVERAAAGRTAKDYTIIIAYDGEKTEDTYFRGWQLVLPPARLTLEPIFVRSGGSPLRAVEMAARHARRARDFAEFWCVCDVDDSTDQTVEQALALAARNDIRLCLSRRSFEIWLLLHFERTDRAIASEADAIAQVATHIPQYTRSSKVAPFYILLPRTETAVANGAWLDGRQIENPSTQVHHLVRKLNQNLK